MLFFNYNTTMKNVAILGASTNQSRMSHKAQLLLRDKGYMPIPINPSAEMVDGVTCYPDLLSCPMTINTVVVYVRPAILKSEVGAIIHANPQRVILNPGTEDKLSIRRLEQADIEVEAACTLVLLNTGQF